MGRGKLNLILFLVFLLIISFSVNGAVINNTINASSPSYLLTGGNVLTDSINGFDSFTDITTGISDFLSSTNYSTYFASSPISSSELTVGYSFNQLQYDSYIFDFTTTHNALITGNLESVFHNDYYGAYFDGASYGVVTDSDDFDIPVLGNHTFCAVFNTTQDLGVARGIIEKLNGGSGYYLRQLASEQLECRYDGGAVADNSQSGVVVNDGEIHVACCRLIGNNMDMWVDGVQVDTDTGTYGDINNDGNLYIGAEDGGSNVWEGTLWQVGIFSQALNDSYLLNMNSTKSIGDLEQGQTIEVYFNETLDVNNQDYFLVVESEAQDITTARIQAYLNETHPDPNNYKDVRLTTGESYVSIDDILFQNYSYPIRYTDILSRYDSVVEDIFLLQSINDYTPPIISGCSVNNTNLGCGDTVRLQCNVTDDNGVLGVWFGVNITNYPLVGFEQANKQGDTFFIDKTYSIQTPSPITVDWVLTNATDLAGNQNLYDPDIPFTYFCCAENWVASWTNTSCLLNDTFQSYVEYTDSNSCNTTSFLPEDNGTKTNIPCNFCSEDLQEEEGICSYQNGTYIRNVTYVDNLYSYCCALTGLESDCSVDYSPYNETTTDYCTIFNNTMECDSNTYTEFGFFGDKTRWICYPPTSNNDSTNCMSYVKDPSSGVIQTNPNYITKTDSLISIDNEYEDRTSFEAVGNMVSVYFTKDNLLFDGREYIFGVRCTNNGNFYDYEQLIIPEYENVNAPVTRVFWAKINVVPIILGLIITSIIMIFVVIAVSKLREGWKGR